MEFFKFTRAKAFANMAAFIVLVFFLFFPLVRLPAETTTQNNIALGFMLLHIFIVCILFVCAVLTLVSFIFLFTKDSFPRKRIALILGRVAKFIACFCLHLYGVVCVTFVSDFVFHTCSILFLVSAVLDIIFTAIYKRKYYRYQAYYQENS